MEPELRERLRSLPGVDAVLQELARRGLRAEAWILTRLVRAALEGERRRLQDASRRVAAVASQASSSASGIADQVEARLADLRRPAPRRVLNASGVLVHTNLGRSPLSAEALRHMQAVGSGYSDLEYDLGVGRRGSRQDHCRDLLGLLTGAEDALVVNNNAAAVVLALAAMSRNRDVVVSRGELVEIGGSFRIPEICEQSGARLREVGTTNRTHARDYEAALGPETGLLLKVHTSNYRIEGFVTEVDVEELVAMGQTAQVPVMVDLGSGALVDVASTGMKPEPLVRDIVASGADLVTWSGDKLLGGPQAGIVVGKRAVVERLRRHPLARALRADKLLLAGLHATLAAYLDPEAALREVPLLAMLFAPVSELESRAKTLEQRLATLLGDTGPGLTVEPSEATVGGGSLPTERLPSVALVLDPRPRATAQTLQEALRQGDPAVLCRIHEDRLVMDLRALAPSDLEELPALVAAAWTTVLKGE